jgi:hypothetical protein
MEARPVSAILEQLLRAYLGFPLSADSDMDKTELSP